MRVSLWLTASFLLSSGSAQQLLDHQVGDAFADQMGFQHQHPIVGINNHRRHREFAFQRRTPHPQPTAGVHSTLAARALATTACTETSDCSISLPANAHQRCTTVSAKGFCTFGCNSGFTATGSSCVASTTSHPTSTVPSTTTSSAPNPTTSTSKSSSAPNSTPASTPSTTLAVYSGVLQVSGATSDSNPATISACYTLCSTTKGCIAFQWRVGATYSCSLRAALNTFSMAAVSSSATFVVMDTTCAAVDASQNLSSKYTAVCQDETPAQLTGTSSSTTTSTSRSRSTTTTSNPTTSKLSTTSSPKSPTTTSAPSCAPTYHAASMISGTGTLLKPTAYVTKQSGGQGLLLGSKPYRIVGVNIYWLCQDENVGPVGAPTDKGRIREALAIAVAMGSNTIRIISCSTSVGNSYSLEPTLNSFSSANWDVHDYAIFAAREYGLRVILPLTDDYNYYTGGKYTFLNWAGVTRSNFGNAFYTNANVISDFEKYVVNILTHKNPYTGKTWATDPTIMAFETGNEMGAYIGKEGYPRASWTKDILGLVKTYTSALLIDGSDGFYNYTTKATAPGLNAAVVDIMSDHAYPRNVALLDSEIPLAASAHKAFLIGEYDWTNSFGGNNLTSFLGAIEATSYIGDLVWSIQGHDSACCNYVTHNDGYSIYYPNGPLNTDDQRVNILAVSQHFYRMTGRAVPSALVGVACPQPVF